MTGVLTLGFLSVSLGRGDTTSPAMHGQCYVSRVTDWILRTVSA